MKLWTSRYQNGQIAEQLDRVLPVGFTRGDPRFRLAYPLAANLKALAPERDMMGLGRPTFERVYRRILDRLGVKTIEGLLEEAAAPHAPREGLVLLCFEDLTKPGLWCHRRMFAAWWEEHTGDPVPELAPLLHSLI